MQNFPQLVIKFILKNIRTAGLDTMVAGSNLSWQGIKRKAVYTEGAGLVCKCTGQCTLEGSVLRLWIKCINFPTWGNLCT